MELKKIEKQYRKFNSSIDCQPQYKNPNELARSVRSFSAVKNVNVSYSSSSKLRSENKSSKYKN